MKRFPNPAEAGAAGRLGGWGTPGSIPPMARRLPHPSTPLRRPLLPVVALLATGSLLLGGCQLGSNAEKARIDQLELKIQQLEKRLNTIAVPDAADTAGKPPAGPVKSLTYRTTDQGNRLRIYWSDGSQSDLECNQEQATLACG
jgi:hypothetical protein